MIQDAMLLIQDDEFINHELYGLRGVENLSKSQDWLYRIINYFGSKTVAYSVCNFILY